MDNPFKGWKILTSCLNNDSLMLIGLYSEKARQHIKEIKNKINKLKLQSNYKNIIKFRKDLIENNNDQWNYIKSSPDFYTVSGVRDLLFHVQEHRFTISKIKEYLDKLGLIFLGFEDQLVKENFKKIIVIKMIYIILISGKNMKKIILEFLQECISFGVKKFDFKYYMAEREGFEPSVVLLLHTLSKRAD